VSVLIDGQQYDLALIGAAAFAYGPGNDAMACSVFGDERACAGANNGVSLGFNFINNGQPCIASPLNLMSGGGRLGCVPQDGVDSLLPQPEP
jgi:hypothetical protein